MLARLEQPAYIGDNRCLPCTVVNVAIAVVLAVATAVVVSVPVGVLVLAVALALVRLRGYLIPGTPTLTRRYLPERALALVGKSPSSGPTVETVSPDDLTTVLAAAGVATASGDAVELTPDFRRRWNERLASDDALEPSAATIGLLFGADEVDRLDDVSFVLDGQQRVRWESIAALAADVPAAAALRSRIDGWDDLAVDERRDLLTGLRLLRSQCPVCGDAVTTTAERLEHCCRRPRIGIRSRCDGCDRPLAELVVTETTAEPWLEVAGTTTDGSGADP
ncbi:hypothetical protein ACFR99_14260 [Haloarchaeobius amylolyticus]|uniref:Uncharacterized protein n=1 Tax=Haloarchaeobius amylolyticus TaxID=1198296 RepID=A0ABD6BJC8_9EURY